MDPLKNRFIKKLSISFRFFYILAGKHLLLEYNSASSWALMLTRREGEVEATVSNGGKSDSRVELRGALRCDLQGQFLWRF